MKTIIVTGSTGFVGRNLVKALKKKKYKVIETSFREPITDLKGIDAVIHLAAIISFSRKDTDKMIEVNLIKAMKLHDLALNHGVKTFVLISACAVYGLTRKPVLMNEEINLHPDKLKHCPYARIKKLTEDYFIGHSKHGMKTVVVQPTAVYGAGDKSFNSGKIIKLVHNNSIKLSPWGGTSWVGVKDLCDGIILAMEKGKTGERYILSGGNLSYQKLIAKISFALFSVNEIYPRIPRITYYPALMASKIIDRGILTESIINGLYNYRYFSSDKAKQELGWKPKQNIVDAVRDAYEYYKYKGLI